MDPQKGASSRTFGIDMSGEGERRRGREGGMNCFKVNDLDHVLVNTNGTSPSVPLMALGAEDVAMLATGGGDTMRLGLTAFSTCRG